MKQKTIMAITIVLSISAGLIQTDSLIATATPRSYQERQNHISMLVRSDRPMGRHLFDDWYVVDVAASTESEAISTVNHVPGVREAELNARLKMHQTACSPIEWFIENTGQFGGPSSVDMDTDAWGAWDILRTVAVANPVRIAVVDSGVDTQHPRFNGVTFYAQKKIADDDRDISDVYGHGTPVASVITAMLPNPTWYELGSYRVFDEFGEATWGTLLIAMHAAITDGSRIINFSGGGAVPSSAVREFITSHPDVLFVISAGNGGEILPDFPAQHHDLPNVISVAAIDQSGSLTRWTNTGALLAAPGQYIFTAMVGCETEPITICQPAGYGFLNGTSFAAPIVSAICAGRMLIHPEETAAQVREKLLISVDRDFHYGDKLTSRGRANFHKLVEIP
jgi:subtilisin family serine protease